MWFKYYLPPNFFKYVGILPPLFNPGVKSNVFVEAGPMILKKPSSVSEMLIVGTLPSPNVLSGIK